jgi:hypothetical protein
MIECEYLCIVDTILNKFTILNNRNLKLLAEFDLPINLHKWNRKDRMPEKL